MPPHEHRESSYYGTTPDDGGQQPFECDYLVIGAGCSGMSFVDTILTENAKATLILVDRNKGPGGHWVHAYPFCKLHQPSCNYGVNSTTLGKNINKKGNERYDTSDRATGQEVVEYYQEVREKFEATGRVRCFFSTEYVKFDNEKGVHAISHRNDSAVSNTGRTADGDGKIIEVKCHRKLVMVATNLQVQSMRKPSFPVHEDVSFVPIHALPESTKSGKFQNYIVFGCGKTGADAIVYLLRQGVDRSNITWIVSRDCWYFVRDNMKDFYPVNKLIMDPMIKGTSVRDTFLGYEANGLLGRLDNPNGDFPEIFKGPVMTLEEINLMRSVENVVRVGRASAVEKDRIVLERGTIDYESDSTLLVDCMAEGNYGLHFPQDLRIYEPGRITLGPLTVVFNASFSAAHIAFLECALDSDDAKNDCCYFIRGATAETVGKLEQLIGSFYLTNKSYEKLMKVPGGLKFLFQSRTNIMSPIHHKGGLPRLMWFVLGPEGGAKIEKILKKKVESKEFSDLDHCFGVETSGTVEKAT